MRKKEYFKVLLALLLASQSACAKKEAYKPTPEGAKQFLKLRGYNFDEKSFFAASTASDVIAVNGFLAAGINPNAKDENGDTVLTLSAQRGDLAIVKALLQGGVDVNAKGANNWTPFLLALQNDRDDVEDFILTQPTLDLRAETPNGMTALMVSVWRQRDPMVRKLLQRGTDVNHQDKDGDTALHGAALYGNVKILEMLLSGGANPNLKNKLGGTALMWAAAYAHNEIAQVLLNKGADARIKDVDGVTAAGWAVKNGQGNLAMLLREAEKNSRQ